MVAKMQILGELGERVVLLPTLIEEGLAANDRLKIRLSLLQEAAAQASHPGRGPPSMERERKSVGLTDPIFDTTVSGARQIDAGTFHRVRSGAAGGRHGGRPQGDDGADRDGASGGCPDAQGTARRDREGLAGLQGRLRRSHRADESRLGAAAGRRTASIAS